MLEAVDGVLEPINARDGATVRVKYAGMLTSDILVVLWAGNSQADTWESEQKPGSVFGYVDFAVPVSVLAASQDKTITVKYAVLRNSQPELSPPLQPRVGKLPESELSTPTVPEADPETGELDLGSFEGDAHVFISPLAVDCRKTAGLDQRECDVGRWHNV